MFNFNDEIATLHIIFILEVMSHAKFEGSPAWFTLNSGLKGKNKYFILVALCRDMGFNMHVLV